MSTTNEQAGAAHVVSVNVGRPRPVPVEGRVIETAIWKAPVAGRVAVRGTSLDGDGQADTRAHGGTDKAVYAYASEDLAWWAAELGRELGPGAMGENLTLAGVDVTGAVIGERWRIGTATFEVAQPRVPCGKLGLRHADPDMPQRFIAARRPGAYLRIVAEGDVGAGDEVVVAHRPDHGVTVRLVFDARLHDRSLAGEALAAADALPADLRDGFARAAGA